MNTQRYCVRNCALRGLDHRNFSSQVLTIRALYDAFEIVISRIVTFLKSYRKCLVSLHLRFSFEIVTPDLQGPLHAEMQTIRSRIPAPGDATQTFKDPPTRVYATQTFKDPITRICNPNLQGSPPRRCNPHNQEPPHPGMQLRPSRTPHLDMQTRP